VSLLLPADLQRRTDLRRMKALATGLLLLTTAIYVATRLAAPAPTWVGFVGAAAEAAMVGALADWFAVTALFRHPLGLPIPHTAIIPSRKDSIGRSLEEFVASNFLSEPVVVEKVRSAQVTARLGAWLVDGGHAQRVTELGASAVRGALTVLRDEDVQAVLEQTIVHRLAARPWGPPAGRLLAEVVKDGTHHRVVDLGVDAVLDWLIDNPDTVRDIVIEQAPAWSPSFVDEAIGNRVYRELLRVATEVHGDVDHPVRQAIDTLLAGFADDLMHDPDRIEQAEQFKERLLAHPDVQAAMRTTWVTGRRLVVDAVEDPQSELRRRAAEGIAALGVRLSHDAELQHKVDGWVAQGVGYLAANYGTEIATVISDTVQRWDATETSERIELQVGRDLQFIRINGTVVGALAGLGIHTLTLLLG